MKKRILFIMHMPPPIHGAAVVGDYIKKSHIINQSFNCSYINLTTARDLQDIGKLGFMKIIVFFKLLLNIIVTVYRTKPNICYVTPNAKGSAFYKDFLIILLLKILRKKIVIHFHNKGVRMYQDKIVTNFLYKIFFKNISVILLAKELFADIEKYVDKQNVYFCPNGLPFKENNINKKSTIPIILFLSNMMHEKGVWILLEACKILKEKNKDFVCNFIGKWSDITELDFNTYVINNNLSENVCVFGAKYGDEKNIFFEQAHVFVFPSYNETFGLVLLEAMMYKMPCISTTVGGIPSVVENNKTGFLIPPQDAEILAEKIEYLLENPSVAQSMGIAGYNKYKQEFTLEHFEKRLTEIFNILLFK